MARGSTWSRLEVEATITSYLEMLRLEIEGASYNKAERRRALRRLLDGRSEAAIERKHQNISAVLIESGFPSIDGYKPLGNYQELLREVVEERLMESDPLIALVEEDVRQPASVPSFDDILAALVEAPERKAAAMNMYPKERKAQPPPRRTNYLLQEIRNATLGRAGERFVLDFERARLTAAGQERLAGDVEHVADTRGDHSGL